jgi:ABC-type glycerol-3-phosphate transport system substrate-binding protein
MTFRLSAASLLLALAAALSISCGGIVDPSQNTVETFSGTVPPGSGSAQKFTASKTGEITVKVLSLTPAAVSVVYVQWVGAGDGSCNGNLFQAALGTANTTAISGQIVSGNYCVLLTDYIGQTTTANYTITVSHP